MNNRVRCALAAGLILAAISAPTAAADADGKIGGKTVDQWMQDLASTDPYLREMAVRSLSQFGEDGKKAVPAISALLNHKDAGVAVNAIMALRLLGTKEDLNKALPSIVIALKQGTLTARGQAALALASIGPDARTNPNVIPTLARQTIKESSWELRQYAALALGSIARDINGPDQKLAPNTFLAMQALITALKDESSKVRSQAVRSLGAIGTSEKEVKGKKIYLPDTTVLSTLLFTAQKDASQQVRMHAVQSLGVIGAPLSSEDLLKEKDALERIIKTDKDKEPLVGMWARAFLAHLDPKKTKEQADYLADVLKKTSNSATLRANAAQAIGSVPELGKVDDLINVLGDDETVAAAAAASLGNLRTVLDDGKLAAIAKLLDDKSAEVAQRRFYAAKTLGYCGPKAKVHVLDLIKVLEDKEVRVVGAAITALGQIGPDASAAVSALTALKQNKEKEEAIREAAAQALEAIEKPKK